MSRREWLRAMRRELAETRGLARVHWLRGIVRVGGLMVIAPLVAAGVAAGVIGGAVANREVFLDVYRSGSDTWIAALTLTLPTALVGLAAALLVVTRGRRALTFAYGFGGLVAISAVISVANVPPVGPFMAEWKSVTSDPRADDHAAELRLNSAIGALAAATALLLVARRRVPANR